MAALPVTDGPSFLDRMAKAMAFHAIKTGQDKYDLAGRLYLAASGWIALAVPNGLVRGIYEALDERGCELPTENGIFSAKIPVMSPEELSSAGGAEKITERGKSFRYGLGRVVGIESPPSLTDIAKAWGVEVYSTELQELRRSYGLSGLPNGGQNAFHLLVAVRRKGVLGRNDTAKGGP